MTSRLRLGRLVITANAEAKLQPEDVLTAIRRHSKGDWGELCEEDRLANDASLNSGSRILSAYRDRTQVRFWIITEADRSATTILLPEDY